MKNPFERNKREEYPLYKNGKPTTQRNLEHLKGLVRNRYPKDEWDLEQEIEKGSSKKDNKLVIKATLKQKDYIHKKYY